MCNVDLVLVGVNRLSNLNAAIVWIGQVDRLWFYEIATRCHSQGDFGGFGFVGILVDLIDDGDVAGGQLHTAANRVDAHRIDKCLG